MLSTTTTLVVEEWICPQWSSLILVQSMGGETISWRLMGSLSKSNCLLQITSHGTSLKFFPYPPTHKLWTKQNERKQTITITTTPNYTLNCSWTIKSSCDCGYHRMHLLWEKGYHRCTLSLKKWAKEVKLQPSTTNWCLCVSNAPWNYPRSFQVYCVLYMLVTASKVSLE